MAKITVSDSYVPNLPPRTTSREMREFLRDELDLIALSVNEAHETTDALRSQPQMFMVGVSDNVDMGLIPDKFVNYSQGGALGNVPIEPDLLTGNIVLPVDGAYQITAFIYGLQQSVTQNESLHLLLDVNDVQRPIATVDVATNLTDDRYMSTVFSRTFQRGDVLSMWIEATGNLGLLVMQATNLEVRYITPVQQEGAGPAPSLNIPWSP